MSPIKHNADSMQNSSNFPSQPKGKKRSRSDQTSESKKKENSVKHNGGDSVQLRSDHLLKSEISKLAAKGLVDSDSVDKLVQLMQPEKSHRKMDLNSRSMLAGILSASDKLDCLNLFVQRRGLAILDDWLKEVQKGKVAKDGDNKQVEDFLLVLLNALDKLPVNLNALQMCNIGKSVNHLRTYKSVEVHRKARSLVDTWKQRVEAEMNNNDAKSSSSPEIPVPSRSKTEISYDWKKHSSASSEAATKTSGQLSSPKSAASSGLDKSSSGLDKSSSGLDKSSSGLDKSSSGIDKSSSPPGQLKTSAVGPITVREEKSSTSSQSHTNSQYSSELARKSGKEDANSSTAGSKSMNRTRQRKSVNGLHVTIPSGAEKVSNSTITCENASTPVAKNNKMVIKIHNRGCSPGKSSTVGASSSPALSQKSDKADAVLKKKSSKNIMPDNDNVTLPDAPEGLSIVQKDLEANTATATEDNPGENYEGKRQSNGAGPSYTELLEMALIRKDSVGDIKEIHMNTVCLDEEDSATDGMGSPSCNTFKELLDMALTRKSTVVDTKEKSARLKDEEDSAIDGMGTSSCNTFKELLEMPLIRKAEHVVKEKISSEEEEIGDSSLPGKSIKADPDVLAESAAKMKPRDENDCKDGVLDNLGASPTKEKHSAVSSLPDNDKKLEFDLNEGFDMDEMKSGELIDFATSSLPTSSLSLDWKGLAATSALNNQAKPLLEIDLNVTDERVLQDITIQNSGTKLKLDLNRVDEDSESAQYSEFDTSTRSFDLNNGPSMDEKPYEPLSLQPHFGLRLNRPTYSAVTDHPFPIMASAPQRILTGLTSTSFNPEFYRGPALSSSPLHYPVFPFGTSFPLPQSGTASYMDPSAPRFYSPAIPPQFMGSAAQYLHPRMVGVVPDNGQSSQNFLRQGLDLNNGPGGTSLDMSMRQFGGVNSPQGLSGEQGRSYQSLAKRKEPDGGWDAADGNSFKQSSWR